METVFADRREAGRTLAQHLSAHVGRRDLAVLGLPRGGVPVAFEVAALLRAPLDVLLVRKLGVPGHEELALGAVASDGGVVLNDEVINEARLDAGTVARVIAWELRQLEARAILYRGHGRAIELRDRTAIVVDDGLATGATMRAAIRTLRRRGTREVLVAVPTAPRETSELLASEAEAVICVQTPEPFYSVGAWYADFSPTTDVQVQALLSAAGGASPWR